MMAADPSEEDRRERPRITIHLEIEVELESAWHRSEISRDLSMGGVAILSDVDLPVGQDLRLKLKLGEHVAGHELILPASVTRCIPGSEKFDVGLRFHPLDSDTSIFLYRMIRYHQD